MDALRKRRVAREHLPLIAATVVACLCVSAAVVRAVEAEPQPLAVESPPSSAERPPNFLARLLNDYSTQSLFLFRSARDHPQGFVLGAVGLTALVVTDRNTSDFLRRPIYGDDPGIVKSAATISSLGNTTSVVPLVFGFGAFGLLSGSAREKETATMLAEALITSETWTALLKTVSGRERPRELDGRTADWMGPASVFSDESSLSETYRSFPSGHATGAWAAATILAHQYPRHGIVPIIAYTTAGAISYSRIALGAHWLSDVVVGGLIGYGCAKQVFSSHQPVHDTPDEPRWRIGIDASRDYQGVNVTMGF
jgi:membrane-associated phospholipid phosphatase